ncbi:Ctr copper transporter family-domain-containing protein [Peziza echinospora]|nr:Ctr copper transporter family-domain-containing protein [Peziza echinospora]
MSHDHTNMDGMDMGTGTDTNTSSDNNMHSMPMAFQTNIHTPLYALAWTPKSQGQYAGTVVFLILLAFLHRFLVAYKAVYMRRVHEEEKRRGRVVAEGAGSSVKSEEDVNAGDEGKKSVGSVWANTPWRFSSELPRAALGTVAAGVGYLLMLAVMTFNVGYFLSVLGGLFLGELVWGRFYSSGGDH